MRHIERIRLQPARWCAVVCLLGLVPAALAQAESANAPAKSPLAVVASGSPLPAPTQAVWLAHQAALWNALRPLTFEEQLAAAEQEWQAKSAAAAPLVAAVRQAESLLAPAQDASSAAKQEFDSLQQSIAAIADELEQTNKLRLGSDAEREKLAANLAQLREAAPLVGEALRHLTEAVGKAPADTTLSDAQRRLTEQLKAMETATADLHAKVNDLATVIATLDAKIKDAEARIEAARNQSAIVGQRVATLQSEAEQLAAALAKAQTAAAPAESAVATAQRRVDRLKSEIAFRDQMIALRTELAAAQQLAASRQAELGEAARRLTAAQQAAKDADARLHEIARSIESLNAQMQATRAAGQ